MTRPVQAEQALPVRRCGRARVEALTRAGRSDRQKLEAARLLFERMLGYANHLGL